MNNPLARAPAHHAVSMPVRITQLEQTSTSGLPLYTAHAASAREQAAAIKLPAHTLMQRAGLSLARLALAVQPHAQRIWIVAGRGNNGGDGLEAAAHLVRAGREVHLSLLAGNAKLPPDAAASYQNALTAGVHINITDAPSAPWAQPDLVIDAVLGRGLNRPAEGLSALAIAAISAVQAPVLAVDLPSGLPGNSGALAQVAGGPPSPCVQAQWTLALLSLAPGLFTGDGRDQAGEIWWDDLGIAHDPDPLEASDALPIARLNSAGSVLPLRPRPAHRLHKGSRGDVLIIGGASGMGGAVMLAARRALASGAGRVYMHPLDPAADSLDIWQPEIMVRRTLPPELAAHSTVAAGCGGGTEIGTPLPHLIAQAPRLLLDADALNTLATRPDLVEALRRRPSRGQATIVTPHPLEAGRLLGITTAAVQHDRLLAAQSLAQHLSAVVVLKGSGTVLARGNTSLWINPTGNAALATPGSGDVLAGWIAAIWAQLAGAPVPGTSPAGTPEEVAELAARMAVYEHGAMAQLLSPTGQALPASKLAAAL